MFLKEKIAQILEEVDTEVIEDYSIQQPETDSNSFLFNLQSNGRLSQAMKFEIKDLDTGGIEWYVKSNFRLIILGDICLCKENEKKSSNLW